jgi:hypothetical protein
MNENEKLITIYKIYYDEDDHHDVLELARVHQRRYERESSIV